MTTYRQAFERFDGIANAHRATPQEEHEAFLALWNVIDTLDPRIAADVRRRYADWSSSWRALGGLAADVLKAHGVLDDDVPDTTETIYRAEVPIPVATIREALRVADIGRWCRAVDYVPDYSQEDPSSPWTNVVTWILLDRREVKTDPHDFEMSVNQLAVVEPSRFRDLLASNNLPEVGDYLIQIAVVGTIAYR